MTDLPPLAAARDGDLATVRRLLVEMSDPKALTDGTPLWQACARTAPGETRLAIVDALLTAGANPRHDNGRETALHAATARGPLLLVERLIAGNALEWQRDSEGRLPLETARNGTAADKPAIVELLDRPVIRDPSFRAAVSAVQQGNVAGLARLSTPSHACCGIASWSRNATGRPAARNISAIPSCSGSSPTIRP